MALLLAALFTFGLVALAAWGYLYYRSASADRRAADIEAAEQQRQAELDAALAMPGNALRCLNCNTEFTGPLLESGCPNCHLSSLVTTENEYRSRTAANVNLRGN